MTEPEDQPNHNKNNRRKRWLINLSALFLLLGIIYLLYWIFVSRFYETTDDAYVTGNLVRVMPKISGRVAAILADETDLVKQGQPLIYLDKTDAEIALNNAEAKLALTARKVRDLYHQVDQLQANVSLQTANLEKAQNDYKRRQGLIVDKYISSEELQHAKIAVDAATASLALAKNQLASAITLVAHSDLYHHPQIQQAAINLRNAYLNWRRTNIYAPATGYIAKRAVEVGQEVNPNQVLMIIIPLEQVWVNANYKESQLHNMRIGQPAELVSDAYGSAVKYKGFVVGLNPGAGNTFDLLPPQNATGNWIKIIQRLPVRININKEQLAKYPLRIGLSMTVSVDTHNRNGNTLANVSQNKVIYKTDKYGEDMQAADQLINEILQKNAENVSYPATP